MVKKHFGDFVKCALIKNYKMYPDMEKFNGPL
jgi:hypothetical protein